MTHDELLAKLEHDGLEDWDYSIPTSHRAVAALRAVVELHKPVEVHFGDVISEIQCIECKVKYPCPTIQAITEELK